MAEATPAQVGFWVRHHATRDLAPGEEPAIVDLWRERAELVTAITDDRACLLLDRWREREQERNPHGHSYSWSDEVIANDLRDDIAWLKEGA